VGQVICLAIPIQAHAGDAKRQVVIYGVIKRTLDTLVAVIADLPINKAAHAFKVGHVSDHINRTAGGIAAKQSALRATQYFHALDVIPLNGVEVGA